MDAPARELGRVHRRKRHDPFEAPMLACAAYGDGFYVEAEGVTDILHVDTKDADENKKKRYCQNLNQRSNLSSLGHQK